MSDEEFELELPDLTPAIGDNAGNMTEDEKRIADLNDTLRDKSKKLRERTTTLIESGKKVPAEIVDNVQAESLTLLIAQINTHQKELYEKRREEKKPFELLAKAVDAFFSSVSFPLDTLKAQIVPRLDKYAKAVAAQRKAEADRLAAEAAAKAATAETEQDVAAVADLQRQANQISAAPVAKTDYGQTSFIRRPWKWKVVDEKAIPRGYLIVDDKKIKSHISGRPKNGSPAPIPGIEFYQDEQTTVRS